MVPAGHPVQGTPEAHGATQGLSAWPGWGVGAEGAWKVTFPIIKDSDKEGLKTLQLPTRLQCHCDVTTCASPALTHKATHWALAFVTSSDLLGHQLVTSSDLLGCQRSVSEMETWRRRGPGTCPRQRRGEMLPGAGSHGINENLSFNPFKHSSSLLRGYFLIIKACGYAS